MATVPADGNSNSIPAQSPEHHLTEYELTEINDAPLIEGLKYIIGHSYSKMLFEFENRPYEFKSLEEIGNLPTNTISSIL